MLRNVLIPIDFSEPLTELREMMALAGTLHFDHMIFLHIINPGVSRSDRARKELSGRIEQLSPPVEYETVIAEGHAASEIADYANVNPVDVVFIPWRKKFILTRTLLGSTTRDVVRLTEKPVYVFKRTRRRSVSYLRVMYATDFQATDASVMPYLQDLGRRFERILLLHVGEREADPLAEAARQEEATANLERLERETAETFSFTEVKAVTGTPHKQIINQARRESIDLIVIGKIDDQPLRQVLGSTAEEIADHAECSFLVIPN